MKRYFLSLVFVIIAGSATSVSANDTMVTLGAGGLVPVKTSEIVMESEKLQIGLHNITIGYVFRNTSNRDIDATIAFPLPKLDGGELYNEPIRLPKKEDNNFVDFKVMEHGNVIPVTMEIRAFLEGKDITAHLASFGLRSSVLLEPLNSALLKLTAPQRSQLETEKLIVKDGFNPPLRSSGENGWWANWSMHVQFYWTQHFPAGKTVELTESYKPVVGGSYISGMDDGDYSIKDYCGNASHLKQIKAIEEGLPKKQKEGGITLTERDIDYILTTANNWSGPIRHFDLAIDTDDPNDIMLTCFPEIKQVSATEYSLHKDNFHPDREIALRILQANHIVDCQGIGCL